MATARLIWYIELRYNFLHLNYYGQDLPLAQLVTAYYIRGGGGVNQPSRLRLSKFKVN